MKAAYALSVMAEYGAESLWLRPAAGGHRENVPPDALPISVSLREQIVAWTKTYQATLNWNDPGSSRFSSESSKRAFVLEGAAIARALQVELGPEYDVHYDDYLSRT